MVLKINIFKSVATVMKKIIKMCFCKCNNHVESWQLKCKVWGFLPKYLFQISRDTAQEYVILMDTTNKPNAHQNLRRAS